MKPVWCVAWIQRDPDSGRVSQSSRQWCATFRGHRHGEDEANVRTACGQFVVLPCGGEKRVPTCAECKAVVARRRGQRKPARSPRGLGFRIVRRGEFMILVWDKLNRNGDRPCRPAEPTELALWRRLYGEPKVDRGDG